MSDPTPANYKFNHELVIKDANDYKKLLGDYQGLVTISGLEVKAYLDGNTPKFSDPTGTFAYGSYTIVEGELTLIFDQDIEDKEKSLQIIFEDADDQTVTHKVGVKSRIHLVGSVNGSSVYSNLNGSDNNELFDDVIGSKVEISKDDTTIPGIVKYSLGNVLVFYVKLDGSDVKLHFEIDEYLSIKDGNNNNLATDGIMKNYSDIAGKDVSTSEDLEFYHSPMETIDVELRINVKEDSSLLKFGLSDTFKLTVKVSQTYREIVPIYLTKDAKYENIQSGSSISRDDFIGGLSADLKGFSGGQYVNNYRLAIKTVLNNDLYVFPMNGKLFDSVNNLNNLKFVGGENCTVTATTMNVNSNISGNTDGFVLVGKGYKCRNDETTYNLYKLENPGKRLNKKEIMKQK